MSDSVDQPEKKRTFVLPLGVSTASIVAAFVGGAVWINSQLSETREAINVQATALRESIHTISKSIATLEASRFTASDGLAVWQAIAEIKTKLAVIDARTSKQPN